MGGRHSLSLAVWIGNAYSIDISDRLAVKLPNYLGGENKFLFLHRIVFSSRWNTLGRDCYTELEQFIKSHSKITNWPVVCQCRNNNRTLLGLWQNSIVCRFFFTWIIPSQLIIIRVSLDSYIMLKKSNTWKMYVFCKNIDNHLYSPYFIKYLSNIQGEKLFCPT